MAIDNHHNNTPPGGHKKKKRAGRNKRQRVHWVDALQAYQQQQDVEKPAIWAEMQGAATTARQELEDPDRTLTYLDEHTRQVLYGSDTELTTPGDAVGDNKGAGQRLAQILPPLLLVLASAVYSYHRAYQKVVRAL